MEIIQLQFKKTTAHHTDLTNPENLALLDKYIFPIIVENEGWDTGNLTREAFEKDPNTFQQDIDLSTWDNVHVALQNNEPIALLDYERDMIETGNYQSIPVMREILKEPGHPLWKKALAECNTSFKPDFNQVKDLLCKTPLYHEIGIAVAPKFQGQKTGAHEAFMNLLSDGFSFGWTSNPIIIRLWRKFFKTLVYYPLYDDKIDTLIKFAMHLHVVADISTYAESRVKPYDYGVISSEFFVDERGSKYHNIAQEMNKAGKLSDLDLKRILYVLQYKSVQGALIGSGFNL